MTATTVPARPAIDPAPRRHRPLMWFAAAMVATGIVAAVGYVADDRRLAGVPIWTKPLLFSVSLSAYSLTLAWLMSRLRGPRAARLAHRAGTVIVVAATLEMVAIVGQVLRGRQSHFNIATGVDRAVYAGMGIAVGVLFAATVVVAVALCRDASGTDRVTLQAVRLAPVITLLGMAVGPLMIIPRPSQRGAALQGAHSVGTGDGGPSLPLTGWSTTGGDLRIPHFIGLHALQALPLLALVLTLAPVAARVTEAARVRLVTIGAATWTGVFGISLWQALRGQPVTAPDGWTLAGLAVVLLGSALTTASALRGGLHPRRDNPPARQ